ncbi:MAG TPA: hypothetical protein QF857_04390 [Gammaproteobacteria bacterium]|jgi:hypothetical protein|nr:hypothetical protein [Gammaproteobacteria bacterium]
MTKKTRSKEYNEFFERRKILTSMTGLSGSEYRTRNNCLDTYDAILRFYLKNDKCPTIRELKEELDLNSESPVYDRVQHLNSHHLIFKDGNGQISLREPNFNF